MDIKQFKSEYDKLSSMLDNIVDNSENAEKQLAQIRADLIVNFGNNPKRPFHGVLTYYEDNISTYEMFIKVLDFLSKKAIKNV